MAADASSARRRRAKSSRNDAAGAAVVADDDAAAEAVDDCDASHAAAPSAVDAATAAWVKRGRSKAAMPIIDCSCSLMTNRI